MAGKNQTGREKQRNGKEEEKRNGGRGEKKNNEIQEVVQFGGEGPT